MAVHKKDGDLLTDKSHALLLLITGENLQSQILANILQEGLGKRCLLTGIDHWQDALTSNQLLLVDCNIFSVDEVVRLLGLLQEKPGRFWVALLNTVPDAGFETLVHWPQIKGLFYNNACQEQLLRGLKEILNRGHWLPRKIAQDLLDHYRQVPQPPQKNISLTTREQQILQHLCLGSTNQEIAAAIHVSQHTVKNHLYNVFRKIGVGNRLQAYHWAKENLT